ncbi:hypothetical protein TWF730_009159 [Orbilia blumenaviensis]|uniref:Ankyrin repeat protein n=1 Tax=Orbilia blumenaviensis TaxID=1796055 RepID=A0AAV9V0Q7_9PEZI
MTPLMYALLYPDAAAFILREATNITPWITAESPNPISSIFTLSPAVSNLANPPLTAIHIAMAMRDEACLAAILSNAETFSAQFIIAAHLGIVTQSHHLILMLYHTTKIKYSSLNETWKNLISGIKCWYTTRFPDISLARESRFRTPQENALELLLFLSRSIKLGQNEDEYIYISERLQGQVSTTVTSAPSPEINSERPRKERGGSNEFENAVGGNSGKTPDENSQSPDRPGGQTKNLLLYGPAGIEVPDAHDTPAQERTEPFLVSDHGARPSSSQSVDWAQQRLQRAALYRSTSGLGSTQIPLASRASGSSISSGGSLISLGGMPFVRSRRYPSLTEMLTQEEEEEEEEEEEKEEEEPAPMEID